MTTRREDFLAYEGPSQIDGSPIVAVVTGVTRPSAHYEWDCWSQAVAADRAYVTRVWWVR